MKKAFITGVTGQDGSYLVEFLLEKGYQVHGLQRRSACSNQERIFQIKNSNFFLHYGDLGDSGNLISLLKEICPDEVYNLAAQSDVGISWKIPEYTGNITGLGVLRILEGLRVLGLAKKTKFYQASTSELFSGKPGGPINDENTALEPQSPYGAAKLYGFWITKIYRQAYQMFACNGILHNHESPRRGENFVTRKITLAAAKISLGIQDKLLLGNLLAKRDWGYAGDFIEAMWLMLQAKEPDDFIIATGQNHSVKEFCEIAFKEAGFEIIWQGEGVNERGIDKKSGKVIVEVSADFFRPAEVECLLGDNSKAREKLGWAPKTSFEQLVKIMVQSDLIKAKKELQLKNFKNS